jgi:5-formaminoimidazole-4-carboxamide-1-beta-D-ribofuranosyl 5'-monophosphate synthetase
MSAIYSVHKYVSIGLCGLYGSHEALKITLGAVREEGVRTVARCIVHDIAF